jgi:ATP-dependent DNA helicase RecG
MFLRSVIPPVNSINGIGSSAASKLSRLGIKTIAELLQHYPRDWEDRSRILFLKDFNKGKVCTLITILKKEWIGYGKMKTLKIYIEDDTAQGSLLCYNRPWIEKQVEVGARYQLWGKFFYKYGELQSSSFEIEPEETAACFGKILPVYRLTAGITQIILRRFISQALKKYLKDIDDELPKIIMEKNELMQKKEALYQMHFPSCYPQIDKARKTLIYEELFYFEVLITRRILERKKRKINSNNIENDSSKNISANLSELQKRLIQRLEFKLTEGQMNAVNEINADMASGIPMARLLQGDVGCGKTLVSFMAALCVLDFNNGQAAIMAPTELLARQHAENTARLLEPLGIRIAFLNGNIKTKGRKELLKNLACGEIDIVVGTHALFSDDVQYKNLKLAVIDEQHRFGVTQRSLIMEKGNDAHLLMMSATPIPRSLALTVFGDMDVSVIKDMPKGRKNIKTHLAKESNEKKVYDFVRNELKSGSQAYFVYPLIDDSEDEKNAVNMTEIFSKKIFKEYKVAYIHSRVAEDEKNKIMNDFYNGLINILVATTVVEVGVDVPNATCMVVEKAQRFGLSALHQLRGRVGRGEKQSYCFLVYSDEYTEDAKVRLMAMLENNDGFVIAEEDLKLRGPGQIIGTEQSGYFTLGIADPVRDVEILENDPDLLLEDHRIIRKVLEQAPPFGNVTL